MPDDLASSFLEGVFKTRELAQQKQNQDAMLQMHYAQLKAEGDRFTQSLNQAAQYQQAELGMRKNEQDQRAKEFAQSLQERRDATAFQAQASGLGKMVQAPTLGEDGGVGQASDLMTRAGLTPDTMGSPKSLVQPPTGPKYDMGDGSYVVPQTPEEQAQRAITIKGMESKAVNAQNNDTMENFIAQHVSDPAQAAKLRTLTAAGAINVTPGSAEVMKIMFGDPSKSMPEAERPLSDDEIKQSNAMFDRQFKAVNGPKATLPPEGMLKAGAKQRDFTTLNGQMDNLLAHTQHSQDKAQMEADRTLQRKIVEGGQVVQTYKPALDAAGNFNQLTDAAVPAMKGDQQAMLEVLMQHVKLINNVDKVSRPTTTMFNTFADSQPWLQKVEKKFDSNGYRSGIVLAPEQIQSIVDQDRSIVANQVGKANVEGKTRGFSTPAPDREPGTNTQKMYLNKAGGDVKKARAAMAADGWSVNQ